MTPPARRQTCFVIIQSYANAEQPDSWNDRQQWSVFRQAWVAIDPDRGREINAGEETIAVVTHVIRGDFLALKGVTEKMRVIYSERGNYNPVPNDAQVYEVLAVMPDEVSREDIMLKVQLNGRRYGELTH